jgi:Fic family protein
MNPPKSKLGTWDHIETGVGNPCRLRILRALMKSPNKPLTRHLLQKRTLLNPREVKKHLEALVDLGWLEEIPYKPKKYRINRQNEDVRRLADFLRPYL